MITTPTKAFEVYAYDYLVKPFKLERIKRTMASFKQLPLEPQLAQKYTVDDIKALEPYVSVKDDHFVFDVEQATADNIDSGTD